MRQLHRQNTTLHPQTLQAKKELCQRTGFIKMQTNLKEIVQPSHSTH